MNDSLEVFDRIGLGDRRTHVSVVPGGSTALVAEIKPNEFLGVWRRARELVDETGRWPLITWAQGWEDFTSDGYVFNRDQFFYTDRNNGLSGDTSVDGLIARAGKLEMSTVLEGLERGHTWFREHIGEAVEEAYTKVRARWGTSPPEADLRRAATEAVHPVLGLQRYLLEWELANEPAPTAVASGMTAAKQLEWTMSYMNPMPPDEPAALILLPTAKPWEVYAYLEGLWECPSDRLIAAAHRWHDQYGAECMVILPGYATELQVNRRPLDIWQAWELAREHFLMAYDTFILPGIEVRDYARALTQSPHWLLNSKP
jgi:Domain of unknown function (DUF4253)